MGPRHKPSKAVSKWVTKAIRSQTGDTFNIISLSENLRMEEKIC